MKPLVITTALLALTGIADAAVLHGHRHRHRHRFSTRDNTVTDTITNGTLTERTVKKLTVGHGTVGNGRFGAASGHGVPGLGHGRKQEGEGECDPVEDVLRGSVSSGFLSYFFSSYLFFSLDMDGGICWSVSAGLARYGIGVV